MSEEVPNNHSFLKFIVIFMGILIVLGLAGIVWKVIDLAKQKAAREEMEATQQDRQVTSKLASLPFDFDIILYPGEKILEISSAPEGIWIRIGQDDKTKTIILIDRQGKSIGKIGVEYESSNQP